MGSMKKGGFPSKTQLWNGAILHTLAHAIWTTANPTLAYEISWDGLNYSVQNSAGARGTVTFAEKATVGVFFSSKSPRSPYLSGYFKEWETFFVNASQYIIDLAQREAIQYILDDYLGTVAPVITTGFWTEDSEIESNDSWEAFLWHSGNLLYPESLRFLEAIHLYQKHYNLSALQVKLLKNLYASRTAIETAFVISTDEYKVLTKMGSSGLEEAKELLEDINVYLPVEIGGNTNNC